MKLFFHADANISTAFGSGIGAIYGQQLACAGDEQSLSECSFNSDVSSCTHVNDAGVVCSLTREYMHVSCVCTSCQGF